MNGKEFLNGIKLAKTRIWIEREELERAEEHFAGLEKTTRYELKHDYKKLIKYHKAQIEKNENQIQRAEAIVLTLPDELEKQILINYYFKNLTLYKISDMVCYSYDYVRKKHCSAIEALSSIINIVS